LYAVLHPPRMPASPGALDATARLERARLNSVFSARSPKSGGERSSSRLLTPRSPKPPASPTARQLASPADKEEWVWFKLEEALHAIVPAMRVTKKEHAALGRVLEHDGFSGKYDEREMRAKAECMLASLSTLLGAAATLEEHASTALAFHTAEENARMREIADLKSLGDASKRSMAAELAAAEVAAAASLGESERLGREVEDLRALQTTHAEQLQCAMESVDSVRSASDARVRSALEEVCELREENARLRHDVLRGSAALTELSTEHLALREEAGWLWEEDSKLRATLRRLEAEVRSDRISEGSRRELVRVGAEERRRAHYSSALQSLGL